GFTRARRREERVMGLFISFFRGAKLAGPYPNRRSISIERRCSRNGEESTRQKTAFRIWIGIHRRFCCSQPLPVTNRRFQFYKSGQLFIRTHTETLSVVAVRVSNQDRSPARIYR